MRTMAGWRWTAVALVGSVGVLGCFVQVGADWDWLAALGDHIRSTGSVPDGVPFAAADTSGWHNVLVLAEVAASLLDDAGPWSVGALHLTLVSLGLLTLASSARRAGAGDGSVAVALVLLCVGSLPALALIRLQTWSLLFFPVLLALVCSQARRPDRRIWWAPVLIAVWGNLHGAVLLGVCVLGTHLLLQRLPRRRLETVGVGTASLVALCLTPQLWATPTYYAGVLGNVSATRGVGLWARPSIDEGLDIALVLSAAVLLAMVLRRRRAVWEYAAVLGLAAATASAARHGVWLLCLLVVLLPAARSGPGPESPRAPDEALRLQRGGAGPIATLLAVVVAAVVIVRGDVHRADGDVVEAVAAVAGDDVVLAPSPLVEALALEGVTVWAGNPLDAFAPEDQAAYLDFLAGQDGMASAVDASDVVVLPAGSRRAQLLVGDGPFEPRPCGPGWTCLVRR